MNEQPSGAYAEIVRAYCAGLFGWWEPGTMMTTMAYGAWVEGWNARGRPRGRA